MIKITSDYKILRQKSLPIDSVEETIDILSKLDKVLATTSNGVGLAAIQIGIPKQVGIIRYNDKVFHLINPTVIEADNEEPFVNEGCLSFPNVYQDTVRYKDFTFKGMQIRDDKLVEETYYLYYSSDSTEMGNCGLQSIAVQHEIDHFNGKLILDHHVVRTPIVTQKAVGRNDKCPCGSGKKYKKCCMS